MIRFYLRWLREVLFIPESEISYRLVIHKNKQDNLKEVLSFWEKVADVSADAFMKTTFKMHNPKTKRKNIGENYRGLLEIRVKKSTSIVRQVSGWIKGICDQTKL